MQGMKNGWFCLRWMFNPSMLNKSDCYFLCCIVNWPKIPHHFAQIQTKTGLSSPSTL
jgi:hypothetical protein